MDWPLELFFFACSTPLGYLICSWCMFLFGGFSTECGHKRKFKNLIDRHPEALWGLRVCLSHLGGVHLGELWRKCAPWWTLMCASCWVHKPKAHLVGSENFLPIPARRVEGCICHMCQFKPISHYIHNLVIVWQIYCYIGINIIFPRLPCLLSLFPCSLAKVQFGILPFGQTKGYGRTSWSWKLCFVSVEPNLMKQLEKGTGI